jgi:DNA-nicking Smr family endonuclease
MAKPDAPHPDELALFRQSVGEVRRLTDDRAERRLTAPSARPLQRLRDDRAVLAELGQSDAAGGEHDTGEEIGYVRPGLRRSVLRRLRRGHYRVAAEIDLHGMTAVTARAALAGFLDAAVHEGLGCVRVIHGKGRRSGNGGPVIKPLVNAWLRRRDDVLAFASARPADGGTGAAYVLLRSRP